MQIAEPVQGEGALRGHLGGRVCREQGGSGAKAGHVLQVLSSPFVSRFIGVVKD